MPIPLPANTRPEHALPLPEMATLIEKHTGTDGTHGTAVDALSLNRRSASLEPIYACKSPPCA